MRTGCSSTTQERSLTAENLLDMIRELVEILGDSDHEAAMMATLSTCHETLVDLEMLLEIA